MLGRTHAVSALAVAHTGLIGYMLYQSKGVEDVSSSDIEPVSIFGFDYGTVMSGFGYFTFITTIILFVLLLLRIGNNKVLGGYALTVVLNLATAYFMFDELYVFQLSLIFMLFIFGALLPDIDSESSELGRYIKPISASIPHRTITHTFWIVLVLGLGVWYFESNYLLALTLGYTFHIIEDSFSKQGIAWFYPILGGYISYSGGGVMKKNRKTLLSYDVGGVFEQIVMYVSIILVPLFIVLYYIYI